MVVSSILHGNRVVRQATGDNSDKRQGHFLNLTSDIAPKTRHETFTEY